MRFITIDSLTLLVGGTRLEREQQALTRCTDAIPTVQ